MVEQFGLAMMPLGVSAAAAAFTSGTIKGTSGSARKADELSTTSAPLLAAIGDQCRDVPPPAENNASGTPSNTSGAISTTVCSSPRNRTVLPALRAEATGTSSCTGKARCSSTRSISAPTMPVAPTTATFKPSDIGRGYRSPSNARQAGPVELSAMMRSQGVPMTASKDLAPRKPRFFPKARLLRAREGRP